jgi:DNA-binding GntR family transcriptional regulator
MVLKSQLHDFSEAGKTAVIKGVIHGLMRGSLVGGQRLTELGAAKMFSVSRTPVREALLELSMMGILHLRRNCGALLLPFGPHQVEDLYSVRSLLEVEATRLAAIRIPMETVERLIGDFTVLMNQSRDDDSWSKDRELHSTLALASGNVRLADEIGRYSSIVQVIREAAGTESPALHPISISEHLRILNCLKDRNADAAAAAMRDHLTQARESARDSLLRMRSKVAFPQKTSQSLRLLDGPRSNAND